MMNKTIKALSIAAIASAASLAALPDAQAKDVGAYKVADHHEKGEGCSADEGYDADKGCGACDAHEGCNGCAADEGCNACAACDPCGGDDNPCGGN